MSRTATTVDVFAAVAEPRRRQLLDLLVDGEAPVNELVGRLGVPQPQVSKHLRVLREVGLVQVRDEGRQRLYRLDPLPLRDMHAWLGGFAAAWTERFALLDEVLTELMEDER